MTTAAATASYPIRLLSPEQFQQLREGIQNTGFHKIPTEKVIRVNGFGDSSMKVQCNPAEIEGLARTMTDLFIAGIGKEPEEVVSAFGSEFTHLLETFGLLERHSDGLIVASVAMYPMHDLMVVSDR